MDQIHFEILGITIPANGYIYHDLGFVKSIVETDKKINLLHGTESIHNCTGRFKCWLADLELGGKAMARWDDYYILYKKSLSKSINIFIRAHEETHALDHMGGLDHLRRCLEEEQEVKIDFSYMGHEAAQRNLYPLIDYDEVKANLGGLYALTSRGISFRRLSIETLFNPDLKEARKIYKQSKITKKR